MDKLLPAPLPLVTKAVIAVQGAKTCPYVRDAVIDISIWTDVNYTGVGDCVSRAGGTERPSDLPQATQHVDVRAQTPCALTHQPNLLTVRWSLHT